MKNEQKLKIIRTFSDLFLFGFFLFLFGQSLGLEPNRSRLRQQRQVVGCASVWRPEMRVAATSRPRPGRTAPRCA